MTTLLLLGVYQGAHFGICKIILIAMAISKVTFTEGKIKMKTGKSSAKKKKKFKKTVIYNCNNANMCYVKGVNVLRRISKVEFMILQVTIVIVLRGK